MLAFDIKSSKAFGFGHLSRSIKLSESFSKKNIIFLINNNKYSIEILKKKKINFSIFSGNIKKKISFLKKKNIKVLINDKLKIEKKLIFELKKLNIKIINFDQIQSADLVDKLILPLESKKNYSYLNKKDNLKNCLFGPSYIAVGKKKIKKRLRKKIKKILVIFGGSDTNNFSLKILKQFNTDKLETTVIFGPLVKKKKVSNSKIKIKFDVNDLFEEFYQNDLLITGGGMIPYEAAYTGLPSLIISTEKHEKKTGHFFEKEKCGKYLGHISKKKFNFKKKIDIKKLSKNFISKIKLSGNYLIKKEILELMRK